MKKIIKVFLIFSLAAIIIYACKEEYSSTNTALNHGNSVLSQRTDPCENVSDYCGNVAPITQTFMVFHPQFPQCTFYVKVIYKICAPNIDIKLVEYYSDPPCEDWFDYVAALSPGSINTYLRNFEMDLIREVVRILGANFAPPCGSSTPPVTAGYTHSSCSKHCVYRNAGNKIYVRTLWCGNGCCRMNYYVCINSNNEVIVTNDPPSPVGQCTVLANLPCPEGSIFETQCYSRCN
ncbi:MAG: hypothetical protein ABIO44_04435 [Saprospiraceae bacterium]